MQDFLQNVLFVIWKKKKYKIFYVDYKRIFYNNALEAFDNDQNYIRKKLQVTIPCNQKHQKNNVNLHLIQNHMSLQVKILKIMIWLTLASLIQSILAVEFSVWNKSDQNFINVEYVIENETLKYNLLTIVERFNFEKRNIKIGCYSVSFLVSLKSKYIFYTIFSRIRTRCSLIPERKPWQGIRVTFWQFSQNT